MKPKKLKGKNETERESGLTSSVKKRKVKSVPVIDLTDVD